MKNTKSYNNQKKFTSGTIITIVSILLIVLFLPMSVFNMIMIIKGSKNTGFPGIFNVCPLIVQTGSMENTINAGDLIFIKKTNTDSIEEGDIISFHDDDFIVTHRVISIDINEAHKIEFTTKGDANNTEDTFPVTEENLIGIYAFRFKGLGKFFAFMQNTNAFIILAGILLILLITLELKQNKMVKNQAAGNEYSTQNTLDNKNTLFKKIKQKIKNKKEKIK